MACMENRQKRHAEVKPITISWLRAHSVGIARRRAWQEHQELEEAFYLHWLIYSTLIIAEHVFETNLCLLVLI